MPILRSKLEETAHKFLKRLEKAKEIAFEPVTDEEKRTQIITTFQKIEKQLAEIDLLPQVKSVEEELIKHFKTLEQKIDGDNCDEHEKFNKMVEELPSVLKNILSVKELISSVKFQPDFETSSTSTTKHGQTEENQSRTASEEWSKLITGDTLLGSESMKSLLRGFEELSTTSQLCLLSLSIFPENCVIKKRPLTYWLIAEGFLAADSDGHTAEEVGDFTFKELINRGFIRAANSSPFTDSFTVHPVIRCMLISRAKKAGLFNFDDIGRPVTDHNAFFLSGDRDSQHVHNSNGSTAETLVTVFNVNQQYLNVDAGWFSKLKRVEVLQLGRWQSSPKHHIEITNDESLKGLGSLKHLRYLSLRGISRIFSLPRSVTQLVSLEILDLRACHNLEKLPSDFSSLRNLTHLDISECYLLDSLPNGLEKLAKLQVLKGFVIGNSSKGSCKINDLAGLKKLRKLSILIGIKAVVEEKEWKKLNEIESLRNLTISWAVSSSSLNGQDTMRSVRLPSNLAKLELRHIAESTLPEWVNLGDLKDLKKLYIRGGRLESLRYNESQDKFNMIRIVRLKYLKGLSVDESQLKAMFPDADYLEATQCKEVDVLWKSHDQKAFQISFKE